MQTLHRICTSSYLHIRTLKLYLFILTREEMKLCYLVSRVAFNFYPLAVFEVPFPLLGGKDDALFNVGLDIRVYAKRNIFFVLPRRVCN